MQLSDKEEHDEDTPDDGTIGCEDVSRIRKHVALGCEDDVEVAHGASTTPSSHGGCVVRADKAR